MANIIMNDVNFAEDNTGLDSFGIISITTLDKSFIIMK